MKCRPIGIKCDRNGRPCFPSVPNTNSWEAGSESSEKSAESAKSRFQESLASPKSFSIRSNMVVNASTSWSSQTFCENSTRSPRNSQNSSRRSRRLRRQKRDKWASGLFVVIVVANCSGGRGDFHKTVRESAPLDAHRAVSLVKIVSSAPGLRAGPYNQCLSFGSFATVSRCC